LLLVAHPKQTLDSYHLIILPKDGGPFQHHNYGDLEREWEIFRHWLAAYNLEKAKPAAKPASEKPAKPRVRVKVQSAPALTMAEMLRAYGHIPGAVV
jgi:hypothetical protein